MTTTVSTSTAESYVPRAKPPAVISDREKLILLILLGAGFMGSVDFSVLNVALPLAGAGVGMSTKALPWIPSMFALPAAGFTLLFGRLGDLFGRRRLFLVGIGLLAAGSVLGGLAANPEMLLTARIIQGLASALTAPSAMSLLTTTFPEGQLRDRVLGLNGALLSGGFSTGALVGGSLVTLIGWRAAFLFNVPVALAILITTPLVIDETRRAEHTSLDVPGAVTVTGGLLATVYSVIEGSAVSAAAGVILLGAFWAIESRAKTPLASPRILRRATVKWGNYAGFATFGIEPAVIFLTTLYLENALHLSPLAAGLALGVPGLASIAAGPLAGRLISRNGTRTILTAGLAVQGLAIVPLALLGPGRSALFALVPALVVGFLGHVTAIVGFNVTATSGLPDTEQGLATGLASMTGQVAMTIGIPALSAIAAVRPGIGGYHLAVTAAAVVIITSAALVRHGLQPRAHT